MKILVFSPYYPPHVGGLESHSDEFNKYLAKKGIEITVFTPQLPSTSLAWEKKHGLVKILRFPAFEIIPNYPLPKFWKPLFWRYWSKLMNQRYDLVISRTRFFHTSFLALLYSKIKNTVWIHIEHGSGYVLLSSRFKTFIAKIYDLSLGSLILKFADRNVSISQAVANFVNKFDKRASTVIYRGMDFDFLEAIALNSSLKKNCEGKIVISFAGRLYKWKGVENTIDAINQLSPEIKNKIIFFIIGQGEDYARLEKLANGNKFIKFLGELNRNDTVSILKISDIYVHSSLPGGGLSTSLLEAMYCGCAIIATPNEGASEIVTTDNAIIIPDSSSARIQEAITELVSDKDKLDQYKRLAPLAVTDKFSWEKITDEYIRLIRETINKKAN